MQYVWQLPGRRLDLSRSGLIMGIVNVTPDSFSDGGCYFARDKAVARGLELVAQGAGILDVGGESTRPGSERVPADEQIRRVAPVIEALRQQTDVLISIDTTLAPVAQAAMAAGADIINDISALRDDAGMVHVAAATGAGLVLMHMQGAPRTMQEAPRYDDVVAEVRGFLAERLAFAERGGVARVAVAMDPGIGFGKTTEHNLLLLKELEQTNPASDRPILLGASRKRFIGNVLRSDRMADRFAATVALTAFGREKGARIFRVHEVLPNAHAIKMTEAILSTGS